MAAFKTLNSQDIIISPLEVNKGFHFEGLTNLTSSEVGIDRYLGTNSTYLTNKNSTGEITVEYQVTIYNSIKQLYYSNYLSSSNGEISNFATASFNSDGTITGAYYSPNYYNFLSSDLEAKRYFPTGSNETIGVISIPKNLYGDYIQPYSFQYSCESGSYIDDGEGRIKSGSDYVGNIIYEHGIVVLTGGERSGSFSEDVITNFVTSSNVTCSFSSSFSLYESQYKCTIGESEFNFTQNPSIATGSNGELRDFAYQEYFTPYITTVGLYNNQYELIAVGKLAQPLPISKTTDTTILVNIDRQ